MRRRLPIDIEAQIGRMYVPSEGGTGGGDSQADPNEQLESMARNLERLANLRVINKGITCRVVTVTSTPTLLIRAPRDRAYTLINPTASIGLTNTTVILPPTTINAAGNTQATSFGVANYDTMHLFVTVRNSAGLTLNIINQVKNPINNTWIDVQDIFPNGITSDADYYFNMGNLGIVQDFAVRWTITGSCTLAVSATMKGGLGGSSGGISNTIYIGGSGVIIQSGYPILEGQSRDVYMAENADLWAVSVNNVNINIIELA
jgi:hypothetical protein